MIMLIDIQVILCYNDCVKLNNGHLKLAVESEEGSAAQVEVSKGRPEGHT